MSDSTSTDYNEDAKHSTEFCGTTWTLIKISFDMYLGYKKCLGLFLSNRKENYELRFFIFSTKSLTRFHKKEKEYDNFIVYMGHYKKTHMGSVIINKNRSDEKSTVLSPRCSVAFWTRPEIIPVEQFFRQWIKINQSINQSRMTTYPHNDGGSTS